MAIFTRGGGVKPGTSLDYKTGTWRLERPVNVHRTAPCHGACPAGEDAQAYLARVQENRMREAWEILVGANPLPAVTGRVCHHPCETSCNRASFDEAISIHSVERFLGDMALQEEWPYPVNELPHNAPGVAVVGAGPAGLSAAYHLIALGYQVTLFDSLPEPGGALRASIPHYRLPREILDAEISRILALGVDFRPREAVGRDVSLEELRGQYKAVFLAPGTQRNRPWSVGGATPVDLHGGLDLLKGWIAVGEMPKFKRVAIHGGGNTAVDLARVLKRTGATEVHVITASEVPGPGVPAEEAMSAISREVHQALEEGVIFHEHRTIERLILRGGLVLGVALTHLKKLPGPEGKIERVSFEGTEKVLHVDQVIPAIGEEVEPSGFESQLAGQPFFAADTWGRLGGQPDLLVGGDARGDRGTVSAAIGDGRRAAQAINAHLRQAKEPEDTPFSSIPLEDLNLNYFDKVARNEAAILPVEKRTNAIEIESGLTSAQLMNEANRCFSCGSCLSCDNCWNLCPDSAVVKIAEEQPHGSHFLFDYEYCKGCGICASECPTGYIEMVKEP